MQRGIMPARNWAREWVWVCGLAESEAIVLGATKAKVALLTAAGAVTGAAAGLALSEKLVELREKQQPVFEEYPR